MELRNFSFAFITLAALSVFCGACQKNGAMSAPTAPRSSASSLSLSSAVSTAAGTTKGAAGQMPAFYDGTLFTVNMMELPEDGSASTLARNTSHNEIYATNDLDDPQDFTAVIDAIQGDGFNPLWRQNLISWNAGFTPRQLTSDDEVLQAASGPNPEITITPTNEMYRCSVVSHK